MKHLTAVALMVMAIVLIAGPALAGGGGPTTSYVDIDTVVMFYKDFYYSETIQQQLSASDVSVLTTAVNDVIEFVWKASNCKANINVLEWIEIDRQYGLDQLHFDAGTPTKFMMHYWSTDGSTSVRTDLYDAGYSDGDVTLVIGIWSLKKNASNPAIGEKYGGECFVIGTTWQGGLLGDSAWITIPVSDGNTNRYWTIRHEVSHHLDHLFWKSGYPDEMVSVDQVATYAGVMDGDTMMQYGNINDVPAANWTNIHDFWAADTTALDKDEDGVPTDADVPIDEASFGSDYKKSDKDSDSFTDLEEAVDAGFWGMSDPNTADTDGDGTDDGSDAEPLIGYTSSIAKNTSVTVDGAIGGGEYTHVVNYNGTDADISVDVYAAWTDGALYIAADVTDDYLAWPDWWGDTVKIFIDVDNDGWFRNGDENYKIWVGPTATSGQSWMIFQNVTASGSGSTLTTTDANASVTHSGTNWLAEIEIPDADLLGVTFSASTQIRIGFEINDRDTPTGSRDVYNILTGVTRFTSISGLQSDLYCVDFTLVN